MNEKKPYVVLDTARTRGEAEVILAILRGAGIPAHTKGGGPHFVDEFTAAQQAMNLVGVKIEVAADHAEDARRVLQEARDAGKFLEGDEAVGDPGDEP